MQVTSDSLFHFTTSLNNLKGILEDKFHISYCREKYTLGRENHESFYPMVSFCDIPLSLAKDQINRYGCYAIGLTKEWGIKNGLNPVVYVEANSLLAEDIQATLNNSFKMYSIIRSKNRKTIVLLNEVIEAILQSNPGDDPSRKVKISKTLKQQSLKKMDALEVYVEAYNDLFQQVDTGMDATFSIFRYIKNYQGELHRKNKAFKNYRFYDEREWRYVPLVSNDIKSELDPDDYKTYKGKSTHKPYLDTLRLSFTSEDIKYLIVKSSRDIPKLIKTIRDTANLYSKSNQADILTTKILTVEQIENDF